MVSCNVRPIGGGGALARLDLGYICSGKMHFQIFPSMHGWKFCLPIDESLQVESCELNAHDGTCNECLVMMATM